MLDDPQIRQALGVDVAGSRASARIYCDISDLLFYLDHHTTVSGIQRVICGIMRSWQKYDLEYAGKIDWVYVDDLTGAVRRIDVSALAGVLETLDSPMVTRDAVAAALQASKEDTSTPEFLPGDIYLIMGAFWIFNRTAALLSSLRRSGLKTGAYLYDIIPITHPEFCETELTRAFTARFYEIAHVLDFAFTISEHVKHEVEAYFRKQNIPEIPITAVPLGQGFGTRSGDGQIGGRIKTLASQAYVLVVGTIEIRKNHAYLVNLWRRMIADGTRRVPKLVFAGRIGWRVRDLMDQLASTQNLDEHVAIVTDASDCELAHLYENCLFTMFPSFVEGWGLPVGESLYYGKVCLASDAASIPEVGGDSTIYIDPYNLHDGYTKVTALLDDPDALSAAERSVRANFTPRDWDDVAEELFSLTFEKAVGSRATGYHAVTLPAGVWLSVGDKDQSDAVGEGRLGSLALVKGWLNRESWGTWSVRGEAEIEFASSASSEATLILKISSPPWLSGSHQVTVSDRTQKIGTYTLKADPFHVCVETKPDPNGTIFLKVETIGSGVGEKPDPRDLGVGMLGFMYYDRADLTSYLRAVETMALSSFR